PSDAHSFPTRRSSDLAWLKENIPRDWSRRVMASAEVPRPEAYQFLRDWQRTLFDAGFVGLTWPKEYGGRGLTFMEELILHEEMRSEEHTSELQSRVDL